MDYTKINSQAWDARVENGSCYTVPISHDVFERARRGVWDVILTACKPVPKAWFLPCMKNGRLDGVKLLGLASGGGQQMPIFAAVGADCTVLDYSAKQLESERIVARREGYAIDIVHADMTQRLPFDDNRFAMIFHPVSNVYIEDVHHVWRECFRVLKAGGVLLAGLDNGFNFIVEDVTVRPMVITGKLPYNPLKLPEAQRNQIAASPDGFQFSHTLEDQIGGQLKAGFVLTDVYEDTHNDPDAIADGIPAYWATRAIKPTVAAV